LVAVTRSIAPMQTCWWLSPGQLHRCKRVGGYYQINRTDANVLAATTRSISPMQTCR